MSDTLNIIKQTHRTILFEEFTDRSDEEVPSLYDIINASLASKTFDQQEFYRKIDENLIVRSFEEFVARFAPKVYEYVTQVNGETVFAYTLDKKKGEENNAHLIKIDGHPFFRMLVNMYSQKGDSDLSNLDFPENEIRKILTPEAQMRDVYDMRRKLRALAIDYEKAKEAGENTTRYEDGIYECRVEISEKFQDSPRALLALAITETAQKIENAREGIKRLESAGDGETQAIASGSLGFDATGKLVLREIPANIGVAAKSDTLALEERAMRPVLALIESDVRGEYGPKDDFSQEMVLSAYAPAEMAWSEKMDLPKLREEEARLQENMATYEKVYRQAQDAFIKTLAKAAEKMLCVKVFFDHATAKGGNSGRLRGGLLVTNCKASKLLQAENDTKKNFKIAMEHLGHATGGQKLWLGILPDVRQGRAQPAAPSGMGLNRPLQLRSQKLEKKTDSDVVDLPTALTLLEIMDECGILTVFSFEPDNENSFSTLSAESVEKMENLLADVNNPHAVLAYPNFTVMKGGAFDLGGERLNIPPVYVSAAYVASAMIAASQQPELLEALGLGNRLLAGNACARVDMEDCELISRLHTKFNRELAYSWPASIIPQVSRRNFGFVFCADPKIDIKTRKPVKHTYILQTRTLSQEDNKYKPVAHTLTQDFIDAYMREFAPGEFVDEELVDRFTNDFKKWENEASKESNASKLNLMLLPHEIIEAHPEGNETTFVANLKGGKVKVKRKVKVKNIGDENK